MNTNEKFRLLRPMPAINGRSNTHMDIKGGELGSRKVYFVWFFYCLAGLLLAIFSPTDVISSNSAIKQFSDFVSERIPSIGKLSSVSSFPEVTALYLSFMWAMHPLVVVFTVICYRPIQKQITWARCFLTLMLGYPLFLFAIYIFVYFPGDVSLESASTYTAGRGKAGLTMISTIRLMLGLVGGLVFTTALMIQYVIIFGFPWLLIKKLKRPKL